MIANDALHYQLLDTFRKAAPAPNATRSNARNRQPQLVHTYEYKASKLRKFKIWVRDLNWLERHVHFVGKDWVASFNFGQKKAGRIYEEGSTAYYATPLHFRGNRTAAEEAIMLAYMHYL